MSSSLDEWMSGYRRAWESNDPDEVGALFTEDAVYYNDPFTEPARGREAIVSNWLERADEPGSTSFEWSPIIETDALSIVQGVTAYSGTIFSNLWVIRFAPDGRATEFTEWWMDQSQPSAP